MSTAREKMRETIKQATESILGPNPVSDRKESIRRTRKTVVSDGTPQFKIKDREYRFRFPEGTIVNTYSFSRRDSWYRGKPGDKVPHMERSPHYFRQGRTPEEAMQAMQEQFPNESFDYHLHEANVPSWYIG